MATRIYTYISECISWLPSSWITLVIGMLGLTAASALVGIIDKAWRLLGR